MRVLADMFRKDWSLKVLAPGSVSITRVASWQGLPHPKKCRCCENIQGFFLSLFRCGVFVSMTRPNSSTEYSVAMAAPTAIALKTTRVCRHKLSSCGDTHRCLCTEHCRHFGLCSQDGRGCPLGLQGFSHVNVRVFGKDRLAAPTRRPVEGSDLGPRTQETRPRTGGRCVCRKGCGKT